MGRLGKKRKKQNWPKGFRVWVTLRSNDNTDRNDEGQRGTDFKRKITNSILNTEVSRSSYGKGNQIWSLTNLELYSDVTRKPSPNSWSETPPSSLSPSAPTITYFLHSTSWHYPQSRGQQLACSLSKTILWNKTIFICRQDCQIYTTNQRSSSACTEASTPYII